MEFFIFIIFFLFILSIIFFLYVIQLKEKNKLFEKELNLKKIEKFKEYQTVLEYYMLQAYSIIYKEDILIYSIEATKLSQNDLDAAVKDFIHLTLKFIGPKLENEFISFFGNYETLYFIIAQFFYEKYENDKIREDSLKTIYESNE